MTDMDWADNAASEAVRNCSISPPLGNINRDDLMPQFAAALRKAKADGMREAAEIVLNLQPGYLPSGPISAVRSVKVKIVEAINQAASKLDPPTT
jgi:hypothetical protein